jgi:hypothetical protein
MLFVQNHVIYRILPEDPVLVTRGKADTRKYTFDT